MTTGGTWASRLRGAITHHRNLVESGRDEPIEKINIDKTQPVLMLKRGSAAMKSISGIDELHSLYAARPICRSC
jgi:hypothetical protein